MVAKATTKKASDKPNPARKPRPRTAPDQSPLEAPSSVSEWKTGVAEGTLIRVPSGKTMKVRTPGMSAFLKKGMIPNALLPIIQESMKAGKVPEKEEAGLMAMLEDPEKLEALVSLCDSITIEVAVEPRVYAVPIHDFAGEMLPLPMGDDRRDPNKLYVDEVDFNDKMFIFNFAVGGSADLEQFRS